MELRIHWTSFATDQLREIFTYYKKRVSLRLARKIVTDIIDSANVLKSNPELGPIEELLVSRKENFRYFIYSNYRLIYWVNEKSHQIEIVDVFDTRQNPEKIIENRD